MMADYCHNARMNYYLEKHLATGMAVYCSLAQKENCWPIVMVQIQDYYLSKLMKEKTMPEETLKRVPEGHYVQWVNACIDGYGKG